MIVQESWKGTECYRFHRCDMNRWYGVHGIGFGPLWQLGLGFVGPDVVRAKGMEQAWTIFEVSNWGYVKGVQRQCKWCCV